MIAIWINGLGEENRSDVLAQFTRNKIDWVVVWNTRRNEPIALKRSETRLVRK